MDQNLCSVMVLVAFLLILMSQIKSSYPVFNTKKSRLLKSGNGRMYYNRIQEMNKQLTI